MNNWVKITDMLYPRCSAVPMISSSTIIIIIIIESRISDETSLCETTKRNLGQPKLHIILLYIIWDRIIVFHERIEKLSHGTLQKYIYNINNIYIIYAVDAVYIVLFQINFLFRIRLLSCERIIYYVIYYIYVCIHQINLYICMFTKNPRTLAGGSHYIYIYITLSSYNFSRIWKFESAFQRTRGYWYNIIYIQSNSYRCVCSSVSTIFSRGDTKHFNRHIQYTEHIILFIFTLLYTSCCIVYTIWSPGGGVDLTFPPLISHWV